MSKTYTLYTVEEVRQLIKDELAPMKDVVNAHSKTIKALTVKLEELEEFINRIDDRTRSEKI